MAILSMDEEAAAVGGGGEEARWTRGPWEKSLTPPSLPHPKPNAEPLTRSPTTSSATFPPTWPACVAKGWRDGVRIPTWPFGTA